MAHRVTSVIIVFAGARVVAVESCAMVVDQRQGIHNVSEQIMTYQLAKRVTVFLLCLRFYFNELYTEPPPEALPPAPPPVALSKPPSCTVS